MDFGNRRILFCGRVVTVYLPWSRKVTAHLTLTVFKDQDQDSQKSRMILGFLTCRVLTAWVFCFFFKKKTTKQPLYIRHSEN